MWLGVLYLLPLSTSGLRNKVGLKKFLFHSQHQLYPLRSCSQLTIPSHTPFSIIQHSAPPAPSSTPRALLNNIRTLASKARRPLHDQSCSPYHAARNTNPGRRCTSVAKKRGRMHRADRTRSSAALCPSERRGVSHVFCFLRRSCRSDGGVAYASGTLIPTCHPRPRYSAALRLGK